MFLPTCPDLRALRELIVSPYLRSQVQVQARRVRLFFSGIYEYVYFHIIHFLYLIQVDTVGVIRAKVNVVTAGFDQHGVQF